MLRFALRMVWYALRAGDLRNALIAAFVWVPGCFVLEVLRY